MTALLARTTYTVDPWDPGYGIAYGDELDSGEPAAALDLAIEQPAESWHPVTPDPSGPRPPCVLFLDGVRRIDARVWVHGAEPHPVPGIAASLAAGIVRCDGAAARVADVRLDRSLYSAAAAPHDLHTRHATYVTRPVRAARQARARPGIPGTGAADDAGDAGGEAASVGLDVLSLAVQRRLAELEVELATACRSGAGTGGLLVVDGPLRAHATHVTNAVGYVKTHRVPYLPPPQAAAIAGMAPGQRSPVFAMTTSWPRHSWYLRLAGGGGAPWSGIVRLECPTDLPPPAAIALADLTARLLPPLASTPHKDPRAPQNLIPIGGLERHLRHRLGDAALLYRALRRATHN